MTCGCRIASILFVVLCISEASFNAGQVRAQADFDHDGDIDQDDFGHLQRCLGDTLEPPGDAGCLDAHLASNNTIDQYDVTAFIECHSGPAVPAAPGCSSLFVPMIDPPGSGMIYHGFYYDAFPGANEHGVTPEDVATYEQTVGKATAWVYFSDNWFEGRAFPSPMAMWIKKLGKVPYVRLMLRSSVEQDIAEPLYTLDAIIAGSFDDDLRQWAAAASVLNFPILVEWGTECNGQWFSWNGWWNGAGTTTGFGDPTKADGPERFVAAYRHIADVMTAGGAANITWVWHVNPSDIPDVTWNRLENYYPGDGYVDWIAISDYGAKTPYDNDLRTFREKMDPAYERLTALAPSKPVIVSEFGCDIHNPYVSASSWANAAFSDLFAHRWPRIIGFCWWNESWPNDSNPSRNTNMIVWDSPSLSAVFVAQLSNNAAALQESPVLVQKPQP